MRPDVNQSQTLQFRSTGFRRISGSRDTNPPDHAPDVIRDLTSRYDYQLKFVIADQDDVEEVLELR